ncbi:hypothetical protein MPSEU_000988400 [Mayamaea pseudoterrestris]|nr:hypothetical protein MPSEU_000988400 [Mayamaea pseudoterrestris]
MTLISRALHASRSQLRDQVGLDRSIGLPCLIVKLSQTKGPASTLIISSSSAFFQIQSIQSIHSIQAQPSSYHTSTMPFLKSSRSGPSRIRNFVKPKFLLFGSSNDSASVSSALSVYDRSWDDDKVLADPYVLVRIHEQEHKLEHVSQNIESIKNVLLCRCSNGGGNEMTFRISLAQFKNANADRDHLLGVIGSLEYLRREIEDSEERFDWKKQCDDLVTGEPLRFSVKDDGNLSLDELKEQVQSYCRILDDDVDDGYYE